MMGQVRFSGKHLNCLFYFHLTGAEGCSMNELVTRHKETGIMNRNIEVITEQEGPVVYASIDKWGCYHHKRDCQHLQNTIGVVEVRCRLLKNLGYVPCEFCALDE